MKTQNTAGILRAVAATVVCALAVATQGAAAGSAAPPGRTQHMATPNDVPKGLSAADWQGIRGAYERHRHAIVANEDGTHQARNPAQQWVTRFDGSGFTVTPDGGGWEWGLELTGYGRAGHEVEVSLSATAEADGQRLEYRRDDNLTEWFVNDARGLEQGWALKERPAGGDDRQELRLALAVRGGLVPRVTRDGTSVSFATVDGSGVESTVLNFGGLKAWDVNGQALAARFGVNEGGLMVTVDDADARYPVTIDPVAQQAYLKASNTGANDEFGWSVAVCGNTVVVGARYEDSSARGINGDQVSNSAQESGAAYVFMRSGGVWSQQAYLKASNAGAQDYFGQSVAVSGDTVIVGANGEDSCATGVDGNQADDTLLNSGAAYVFVRNGSIWTQQAYLKASNTGEWDYFGCSVAVDGDTVVVGAQWERSSATGINGNQLNDSAHNAGAAYVFVRNGITWTQQAYLKASNTGAQDYFGYSVAAHGDSVVVGAFFEDSNATGVDGVQTNNDANDSGAAYIFGRSGTIWSQQAYLKASNTEADDIFGYSVAVSGDTVVVGAPHEGSCATGVDGDQSNNAATNAGAVYVFVHSEGTWSQQAYLKASNSGAPDDFGISVAAYGDLVLVGAWGEDSSATGINGNGEDNSLGDSGAAYVFQRSVGVWSQQAYLKASNAGADAAAGDVFGRSVSVSGNTVVVGAINEDSYSTGVNGNQADNSALNSGAVYVFSGFGPYTLYTFADHGTAGGAGTYEVGNTATLTATPDPGYIFTGWTGDASGTDNPLEILMDSDKTIGATFEPDLADGDGDGLSNYEEAVTYGTDPTMPDTDGDRVEDGWELGLGRYVLVTGGFTWAQAKADSEIRGGYLGTFTSQAEWAIALQSLGPDALDSITGAWIGATDAAEEGTWTWITGEPFSFSLWADGQPDDFNNADVAEVSGGYGALPGKWFDTGTSVFREGYILETDYSTNPTVADTDGDGLSDGGEKAAGSNPFLPDTDGDGLSDGAEVNLTQTSPTLTDSDGNGTADGAEDPDADGLDNLAEVNVHGTDPRSADTDGDGVDDGVELVYAGSFFDLVEGTFTWPQAVADAAVRKGRVAAFPDQAGFTRTAPAPEPPPTCGSGCPTRRPRGRGCGAMAARSPTPAGSAASRTALRPRTTW